MSAAVGIDSNRGDQVVVQTIPFDQPTVEIHNPTWIEKNNELLRTVVKYAALVIAALLVLIFIIRPAKRALKSAATEPNQLPAGNGRALALNAASADGERREVVPIEAAKTVAEIEAEMEAQVAREMASATTDIVRASTLKKQLVERSKKSPESVAMTIRGWLQEPQR